MDLLAPWHVECSQTRYRTRVPALTGRFLTAIPQGTPINSCVCVSVCLFIHSFEGTAIYVMKISELDAMGTRKLKMPWSLPSKTLAGR